MIEHDPCLRKRTGKIDQFADLRVKQPGIETQAERRETGKALAKRRVKQQAFRARRIHAGDIGIGVPCRGMPDAAKASASGGDFGFQNLARAVAEQEIDVADDAGADRRRTVAAACAHRRDAVDELDLADRAQRFGSPGAIHRARLDIDGRDDVVAGRDIAGHLLDQIALPAAIPQMMMRIDDRARGIDDFLGVLRRASPRADRRRARSWWWAVCWPWNFAP